jgi:RimJ/RimL family protein N-acetyltransferase
VTVADAGAVFRATAASGTAVEVPTSTHVNELCALIERGLFSHEEPITLGPWYDQDDLAGTADQARIYYQTWWPAPSSPDAPAVRPHSPYPVLPFVITCPASTPDGRAQAVGAASLSKLAPHIGGEQPRDSEIDPHRWQVGLWLGPDCRGQGIGSQALLTLMHIAHQVLPAQELIATPGVGNLASVRMFENVGFRAAGHTNVVLRGGMTRLRIMRRTERPFLAGTRGPTVTVHGADWLRDWVQ